MSQVSSQTSSVSSCDDYIIVLPDCFDTSRPLGESMYSSAVSQPDAAAAAASAPATSSADPDVRQEKEQDSTSESGGGRTEEVPAEDTWPPPVPPISSSVNQMLCASQTLDTVMLTPEVVPPPVLPPDPLPPPPTLYSPRLDDDDPFPSRSFCSGCGSSLFPVCFRSEALYLAEDPSPPACDPYEPRQPRVQLNGEFNDLWV